MGGTFSDHPPGKLTSLEKVHAFAALSVTIWVGHGATGLDIPVGFVMFWCAGLMTLVAAARFPALGVYVFIALTYGTPRYHSAFVKMVQLGIPNWVCAVALSGVITWAISQRRRVWVGGPVAWLMLMLVGWLSVTIAAATIRGQPWQPHPRHHPQQYLQALVMFFIACRVMAGPDQAANGALAICLALCGRGLIAGRQGVYLEGDISSLSVMAMPLALLGMTATPQKGLRVGFLVLLAALIALLSLTYNRAAAVGFVVLLVVLWTLSRYKWRVLVVSIPVLVIAGTLFTSSFYWQRFTGIWEGTPDRNSVLSRLRIWQTGWDMFVDHPIVGVGAGQFHNMIQRYNPRFDEPLAGHNNFVQMLAESGAPGLLLYTLLFVAGLITLWQTSRIAGPHWPGPAARLMFASICVYLTIGCFVSRQDMVLAYLLLGWAVALRHHMPDCQR